MCPVILLALISSLILFLLELSTALTVVFTPSDIKIKEETIANVSVIFSNVTNSDKFDYKYRLQIDDNAIANILGNTDIIFNDNKVGNGNGTYNQTVQVRGQFIGFTEMSIVREPKVANSEMIRAGRNISELPPDDAEKNYMELSKLPVIVTLKQSRLSTIFTISVITLVTLLYINMGCALDLQIIKNVLRRPVAPMVGFITQYVLMPLISYGVGYFLFEESFLRLGLFTFGCSPGGGASNMWTVLLGGNLNLSIAMTFISTLSATFMMPIWLFTLGRSIFVGTTSSVPFSNIVYTILSMVIFLGIGLAFQKYLPKVAKVCRKILAPVSVAMIIFIIIFGTYANLFMFKYMSLRILIATALNVWIGFFVGFIVSLILRFPTEDITAISIETGVQNTGVAIILLRLSLEEPFRDLATVIPVAASLMMPIPLTIVWISKKVISCMQRRYLKSSGDSSLIDDENNYKTGVTTITPLGPNNSSTPLAPSQSNKKPITLYVNGQGNGYTSDE